MNIIAIGLTRGTRSSGADASDIRNRRLFPDLGALAAAPGALRLRTGIAMRAVQDWWRLRSAVGELHDMDDRMLRDIGVTREEIARAVRFGRESLGRDGAPPFPDR